MTTPQRSIEECRKKWPGELLEAARQRGDPEVDRMAALLFSRAPEGGKAFGAQDFNFLTELMNKVLESPELVISDESLLVKLVSNAPREYVKYFDPIVAPDWVDEKKLAIASELWRGNSLAMLETLFAASLPACYLMKRGIPALYQSQKLLDSNYLFQRVYETAMMLSAVMDPNGFRVVTDVGMDEEQCRQAAYDKLDPEGVWRFTGEKWAATHPPGREITLAAVEAELEEIRRSGRVPRFVWGKGLMIAKKVRFLHASMRFLMRNPSATARPGTSNPYAHARVWDESLGSPVNQEDLAFTLFTFGVLLPRGLKQAGRLITVEQKEAFLHLWKLVGYVMGIEEQFLTDNLQEAEYLYQTIKEREKGGSNEGVLLSSAVIQLLEEFLPRYFGMNNHLGVLIIEDQLGTEDARLAIFGETESPEAVRRVEIEAAKARAKQAAGGGVGLPEKVALAKVRWLEAHRNLPLRFLCLLFKGSIRSAYFVSEHFLRFLPLAESFTQRLLHRTAEEFIESWRSAYVRRPLDIPHNVTVWVQQPGVDENYSRALRAWRRRVFNTLVAAIACLMLNQYAAVGYFLALALHNTPLRYVSFYGGLASFLAMYSIITFGLPRVIAGRKEIEASRLAKSA